VSLQIVPLFGQSGPFTEAPVFTDRRPFTEARATEGGRPYYIHQRRDPPA